jgi:DedD protein
MAVTRTTSVVSEEELQLRKRARRRLVGAITLVAIAVIVLPLVLDHEPSEPLKSVQVEMAPPPATQTAAAPPAPSQEEPAQPAPVAEPAPPSSAAPPPAPIPAPAEAPPAAVQPPPPPTPVPMPGAAPARTETKPFAVAPKPAQPAEFVIQLGAFGEIARARAYEQKLRKAGFPVYLERVNGTNKTRVRAGPYGSREAAERAYQQMKQRGLADPRTVGQIVPRGQ